jgi:DnaA-homolog protein
MKQLPLDLLAPRAPSFDGFQVGHNSALMLHLRSGSALGAPLYLWGGAGCGKTHLLRALAASAQQRGLQVAWFDAQTPLPWDWDERFGLVLLDDCEAFDEAQQHAAFALLVQAQTALAPWAAAGTLPPVDLPLREDLRSRLGWGHVFEVQALAENETRAALRIEADRRGILLSDEVMAYLLTRFERDLKHLMALLDQLDHYAMAQGRAVTVPLLKRMLSEEQTR